MYKKYRGANLQKQQEAGTSGLFHQDDIFLSEDSYRLQP